MSNENGRYQLAYEIRVAKPGMTCPLDFRKEGLIYRSEKPTHIYDHLTNSLEPIESPVNAQLSGPRFNSLSELINSL